MTNRPKRGDLYKGIMSPSNYYFIVITNFVSTNEIEGIKFCEQEDGTMIVKKGTLYGSDSIPSFEFIDELNTLKLEEDMIKIENDNDE